ncbi:ATP-dependent helicase [Chitinasiproducens palmae]|uniref:ATP-dependent helicase n=1 Tax=Chitinasiproducens palmae TaxID=1770053 RepID=UPI001F39FCAA|nr:ATP-dependent helicase [Chitinasiproducens palmae]
MTSDVSPTTPLPPDGAADALARLYATLNDEQRAVVDAPADLPLQVIAGAGTGKTNTLVHRVIRLIERGVAPDAIMLLTFSRRAAEEMRGRVMRLLASAGMPEIRLDWAGTFHATGAQLLRDYAGVIGLSPNFTIADRDDSADLLGLLRHELGLDETAQRFPTRQTCLAIYSRVVNTGAALQAVVAEHFPWCAGWEVQLKRLFANYVAAKQADQVLDYDDLLLIWERMLDVPLIADDLRARFSHVLVDEYQDTNRLQASLLFAMRPHGQGLTVVGDDAQSIYAFRGAEAANMFEFVEQCTPAATVLTLTRNYRSSAPLLAASNAVIHEAARRHPKTLWTTRADGEAPSLVSLADETAQADYVSLQALARREGGARLRDQAILFRTGTHSAALEVALGARRIPFRKFGGLKFLDAAHVRDLLAILRFAQNPRERVAGFRVLQLLPGVGAATAAQTLAAITTALGSAVAPPRGFRLPEPKRALAHWDALADLLAALAQPVEPVGAQVERALAWYEPWLAARFDDAAIRIEDLHALARIAHTYPSRERFLAELTLDPPDAVSDQAADPMLDDDYLILSTIHSAKGREWRHVTLLNAVDGCLPADMATRNASELEEERRLLYVAMTRARETLEIVLPLRFHVHQQAAGGDRHVFAQRTRFIPPKLLSLFDSRAWPSAAPSETGRQALAALRVDIAAKLRSMWD